jgi:hypothetical protein
LHRYGVVPRDFEINHDKRGAFGRNYLSTLGETCYVLWL